MFIRQYENIKIIPGTSRLENVKKKEFNNRGKPKSYLTLNVIKIIIIKVTKEYQIILKYIKRRHID